jgi:phosphohistidine phosphatase
LKTLALLRHAKSSWDDTSLDDFDRPLAARGIKAAKLVGTELRKRRLAFDLVLASPARRVSETIVEVENGYGKPLNARIDPRIYGVSEEELLSIIRETGGEHRRILVIGHNPTLQQLAADLAEEGSSEAREIADHYPTAALTIIDLPAEKWREVEPGSGRIALFLRPRDLQD